MWHTTTISCTRWFQICKFHAAETDSITSYCKLLLRTTRDQTVPQSVPRYCGVVQHRTPCYKILQGTTAYYQVLLGATKSNMVAFRATTQYKATVCTRKYSSLLQSFRLRSHVSQRIAPWLSLLQGPTRYHEVLDRTSPYYTEFDVVTPQLVAKLRIFSLNTHVSYGNLLLFTFRLSCQNSPNTALATKSDSSTSLNIAPATKNGSFMISDIFS